MCARILSNGSVAFSGWFSNLSHSSNPFCIASSATGNCTACIFWIIRLPTFVWPLAICTISFAYLQSFVAWRSSSSSTNLHKDQFFESWVRSSDPSSSDLSRPSVPFHYHVRWWQRLRHYAQSLSAVNAHAHCRLFVGLRCLYVQLRCPFRFSTFYRGSWSARWCMCLTMQREVIVDMAIRIWDAHSEQL